MDIQKLLNQKPATIFKVAGIIIVAVVVIAVGIRLIGQSLFGLNSAGYGVVDMAAPSMPEYDMAYNKGGESMGLSARNVIPTQKIQSTTGNDAESFEVTEYSATLETNNLTEMCEKIVSLKSRPDVIFESAGEYRKSCNYTFKVEKESVPEILNFVKGLKPRDLNENTETVKRLVDDFTSELDILTNKMTTIEKTLTDAVRAYDDVTLLATRTQNVESLAKIIESKLNIVERLTQERINVNAQIERLTRAKANQLDRLDYTYFNINVFENKFVDWQQIKDSWKTAVRNFVSDVNNILEDITVNLLAFLFVIIQYALYLVLTVFVVKYLWKVIKYIWSK